MNRVCIKCKQDKKHQAHGMCRNCYKNQQRSTLKPLIYEFVNNIKLQKGCVGCGYKSSAIALDFDHVRGQKDFGISRVIGITDNLSERFLKSLMQEIGKCEIRCANCHRIATFNRKQYIK